MSLVEILLFAQLEIVLFSNTYLEKKNYNRKKFSGNHKSPFFSFNQKVPSPDTFRNN